MQTNASTEVAVKMVLDNWHSQQSRVTKLINSLSDEELAAHTAPGRNTGVYILGHLTAVNDRLIELQGWGKRDYEPLDAPYLLNPEGSVHAQPPIADLRNYWTAVNERINAAIATMSTEDWFAPHTAVSAEEFAKEPHRNKLNVMLGRAMHSGMHLGQMNYLQAKK
jgi:hypothetical protein